MAEADVVVATTGVPGLIEPEMVREGQVILALTNPYPEIESDAALAAGAAFAADGREREQRARLPRHLPRRPPLGGEQINAEMKLAAAQVLASLATGSELVPDALDPDVHLEVAEAVREAAIESGVARLDRAPTGL